MTRIRYRYLLIVMSNFICHHGFAQDPLFTQSHTNAPYFNPALTGCYINPVAALNFRIRNDDYTSYYNYSASYHQTLRLLHGGVGGYYLHDQIQQGTLKSNQFGLSYAAHFEIRKKLVVRIGISGSYVEKIIDWDKLNFGDMIDSRYGFIYPTTEARPPDKKSFFDYGVGMAAYLKNIYFNCAVDHIGEPQMSFLGNSDRTRLPRKYLFNAGVNLPLGDSSSGFSIHPDLIYLKQKKYDLTVISATARLKYLLLGVGVKIDEGGILLIGVENRFMRFSYSFDLSTDGPQTFEEGPHEFSLVFKITGVKPKKGTWTPMVMEAL